jgi:hypothetical protein
MEELWKENTEENLDNGVIKKQVELVTKWKTEHQKCDWHYLHVLVERKATRYRSL